MCGLAGILSRSITEKDTSKINRMLSAAKHRGPDATKVEQFDNVLLGHNRLSIIDLNDRSIQPFTRNNLIIVFNGEIYNYIEIRVELQKLGHSFETSSDTEVLIAGYEEWGAKCLTKLNGMFSFAILDKKKREVFLARDRFGIKPLYLYVDASQILFASEIKQISSVLQKREVNEPILFEYLMFGYENCTQETFFKGINSVAPGEYLKIDIDSRQIDRENYYSLKKRQEYSDLTEKEATSLLGNLLEDSIRLRLRSDVKVGTCLSGGLDSSLISAFASQQHYKSSEEKFVAIHARSSDTRNDESAYAKLVSDTFDLNLETVMPSSNSFVNLTDEVVYTQEEPFGGPSMYMGWHVFQRAADIECKVMLNGQGADELLLGYERYFPLQMNPRNPVRFLHDAYLQSQNSRISMKQAILYYFYFRNRHLRHLKAKSNKLFKFKKMKEFGLDKVTLSADGYADPFTLQKLEIESLQLPHLLRYEDRSSMRHSVETRLPFMDYRLVEAAVSLPLKTKLNAGWNKYTLRKVAEGILPDSIVWRKEKFGFEAPNSIWFKEAENFMRTEILNSDLLKKFTNLDYIRNNFESLSDRNRWALFNTAVWSRVYNIT